LVYGNLATELTPRRALSAARGDAVRRVKLDWHAAEWRAVSNACRSDKVIDRDFAVAALVRRMSRKSHLADVVSTSTTLLATADEVIE
jgi:hypothetical protein